MKPASHQRRYETGNALSRARAAATAIASAVLHFPRYAELAKAHAAAKRAVRAMKRAIARGA